MNDRNDRFKLLLFWRGLVSMVLTIGITVSAVALQNPWLCFFYVLVPFSVSSETKKEG